KTAFTVGLLENGTAEDARGRPSAAIGGDWRAQRRTEVADREEFIFPYFTPNILFMLYFIVRGEIDLYQHLYQRIFPTFMEWS
ncbi:MAG: hypothetical protein KDA94_16790, partial [Acidimicrobiales bacterium]|nr:hypothetical protein [Acidimicrobiales bacterium]